MIKCSVCVCFQRWNPVDSFTDTLLPTDRWPWSDVTGMNPQPLHSFELPSHSWEWEGDWYVDQSCGGEPSQTGVKKHKHAVLSLIHFLLLLSNFYDDVFS